LQIKFGALQKSGAIDETLTNQYKVQLTTQCGYVITEQLVSKGSDTLTCCDGDRYSVSMTHATTHTALEAKYVVIKAVGADDDGGVKVEVIDAGASPSPSTPSPAGRVDGGAESTAALSMAVALAAAIAWALA